MKNENIKQKKIIKELYKSKKELIHIHEKDFRQTSIEILQYKQKEPWKFLRKSHKKWVQEMEQLKVISEKYDKQLSRDYQELEHLIDLSHMIK